MEKKYTITIEVSTDGMDIAPAKIGAVFEMDADGDPLLVELTVRAPENGKMIAEAASLIDLEGLVRSISGALDTDSNSLRTTTPVTGDAFLSAPGTEKAKTRPYRRMPEVDKVRGAFLQTGESVGKLAQYYEVPRYTAQAWVDRLKRMGELETVEQSDS